MELIWLKSSILWHSSRIPSGYDYSKLTAEQIKLIETRWHDYYTADWDYGFTTVEFFCTCIGVMFILRISLMIHNRASARRSKTWTVTHGPNLLYRLLAAFGHVTSRQLRVSHFGYYSPPLGHVVAVGSIFAFVMALMLATRPYYWPNEEMGHSPPIATRSGWISMAIMPFMIAFATKVNFIGLLTGSSHEGLQVYHRWTATLMYITSLVHTFSFIVNDIKMGEMVFKYQTSPWFWTGIVALVPQTYLILMSWSFFRNRYYETFKKLHFIAAGIFMAALFIHCNFRLTSWDYFWATAAIYGLSWLTRVFRMFYISGLGLPATIEALPEPAMIKVTVDTPSRFVWKPGQHIFLRFLNAPGLHALSSHPFTIASPPSTGGRKRNVEIIFRLKGGITTVLAGMALGKGGVTSIGKVLVDGPYGGVPTSLRGFDRVHLLAGGTGSTFTLPLLMDLAEGSTYGMRCAHVNFIYATRHSASHLWLDSDLALASKLIRGSTVSESPTGASLTTKIYVTDGSRARCSLRLESDAKDADEGEYEGHKGAVQFQSHTGRPVLSKIIQNACQEICGERIAFVACGPESFIYEVRNAVAQCQLDIANGAGGQEIYLHAEHYHRKTRQADGTQKWWKSLSGSVEV